MMVKELDLSQLLDGDRFILGLSGRNVVATKVRMSGDTALLFFDGRVHTINNVRLVLGDALETPSGEWLGRVTFLSRDV